MLRSLLRAMKLQRSALLLGAGGGVVLAAPLPAPYAGPAPSSIARIKAAISIVAKWENVSEIA